MLGQIMMRVCGLTNKNDRYYYVMDEGDDLVGELLAPSSPPRKKRTRGGKGRRSEVRGELAAGTGDQIDEVQGGGTQPQAPEQTTKPRGITRALKAKKVEHKPLAFDEYLQPCGEWAGDFTTEVGIIVREYVDITLTWKQVDEGLKRQMFDIVQKRYAIPDEKPYYQMVKAMMDKKFRDHKQNLVKWFITKKLPRPKGDTRQPWEIYTPITEEKWKVFYENKLATLEYRARQSANAKQNEYHHVLGAKGINRRVPEWVAEGELPADMSTMEKPVLRHTLWKLSRSKKDPKTGERMYPFEKAKEVVQKIDELGEQVTQGTWAPDRYNDHLTQALGKKDHYGRVVGMGGAGITLRKVFGNPGSRKEGKSIPYDEHVRLISQIKEQIKNELKAEFYSGASASQPRGYDPSSPSCQNYPPPNPHIEAFTPVQPNTGVESNGAYPYADVQEPINCNLLLPHNNEDIFVAYGRVYSSGPNATTHGLPLQPYHARVSVDEPDSKCPDLPLPVPQAEFTTVRSARSAFVQWPVRLIQKCVKALKNISRSPEKTIQKFPKSSEFKASTNVVQHENLVDDSILARLRPNMRTLHDIVRDFPPDRDSIVMRFEDELLHYEDGIEIDMYTSDMKDILKFDWVPISAIHSFILFLHEKMQTFNLREYGFLCPERSSYTAAKGDPVAFKSYMQRGITNCIKANNKYALLPYHQNGHWVLLVLCLDRTNILFLDPLQQGHPKDIKIKPNLNIIYQSVMMMERKVKIRGAVPWTAVKCPRQPGHSECGYYVMRYMHDIITLFGQMGDQLEKVFPSVGEYNKPIIDDMMEDWAEYLYMNLV